MRIVVDGCGVAVMPMGPGDRPAVAHLALEVLSLSASYFRAEVKLSREEAGRLGAELLRIAGEENT